MTTELFLKVLAHIIKHIDCTKEKPAVLLMDNHENHLGLEVVEMARSTDCPLLPFQPTVHIVCNFSMFSFIAR